MQRRAERAKTLQRLDLALESEEDHIFLKAFQEVADRGFGKAPASIDVTSAGEQIQALLMLPPETE